MYHVELGYCDQCGPGDSREYHRSMAYLGTHSNRMEPGDRMRHPSVFSLARHDHRHGLGLVDIAAWDGKPGLAGHHDDSDPRIVKSTERRRDGDYSQCRTLRTFLVRVLDLIRLRAFQARTARGETLFSG